MTLIKGESIEMMGKQSEIIADYILHYLAMRKDHKDLLMMALYLLDDYEKTGKIKEMLAGMNNPLDE